MIIFVDFAVAIKILKSIESHKVVLLAVNDESEKSNFLGIKLEFKTFFLTLIKNEFPEFKKLLLILIESWLLIRVLWLSQTFKVSLGSCNYGSVSNSFLKIFLWLKIGVFKLFEFELS